MDRQWRVAMISEHASPAALLGGEDAGGQNVYVDAVSRGLASRGYAVDIFTRRDDPEAPLVMEWGPGVRIVNVTAGPARHLPKDGLWRYMPTFRDSCMDFAERYDVRYHVLHGNFWMSGWVLTELQRVWGIPGVQLFHATGKTKQRHQGKADTSPSDRIRTEMEIVRQASAVITQCPTERDEMIGDYGADPAKIAFIPGAVNTEIFRPLDRAKARQAIGLDAAGPVIVYVGRILPRKDVANILHALARLARQPDRPCPTLLVVGGGEGAESVREMARLRELAGTLEIAERVRFVGQHQPATLRDYYCAGDIAVTTPWYEPFGLTPLEAMACGRPVVGSAVGGLLYTIVPGQTGLLVPPRDPVALAAALGDLFTHPVLLKRMGRAGLERVQQGFTWAHVAQRTDHLFRWLLASQGEAMSLPWRVHGLPGMADRNVRPTVGSEDRHAFLPGSEDRHSCLSLPDLNIADPMLFEHVDRNSHTPLGLDGDLLGDIDYGVH